MIQVLLGHNDVKTMEMYTHVLKQDGQGVVVSPLDDLAGFDGDEWIGAASAGGSTATTAWFDGILVQFRSVTGVQYKRLYYEVIFAMQMGLSLSIQRRPFARRAKRVNQL